MAKLGGEIATVLEGGRELRVREARTRDSRSLTVLVDSVAAEPEATLLVLPGQVGPRVWRRRIGDALIDPRALLLVATVDGELAGDLSLRPDPYHSSPHVAVIGIAVGKKWRRLGVGSALMEAAAEWAAAQGVLKLVLSVFLDNQSAIRFYESHGFVREGLRRAHLRRGSEYHDEVLMARFLTPIP